LHRARDLAERLGEHDVSRNLAWSEWAAMSTAGRVAESRPLARQYLERWGADVRPQVAGGAHTLFGVDEWSRGRITSALEHLGRAVELFEGGPPPADAFEAEHRLVALGFGLFCQAAHGDLPAPAALDVFEAAIAELPPVAVPAACMFAGAVAAVHGRFDRLERLIAHAVEVDPSSQFAFFGGQMLMFRGLIAATRGDLDEAIATFVEGRHRYRGVGGRSGTSSYQALLGELLARAGRVNDAAELISGARRQLDDSGDGWNEVTVAVAEGVLAHAAGDSDRAAERFRSAISTGREQGALALAERAADVAAGLGVLT
jgi:tetratricopeptide (TPR) repeat protein